MADAKIVNIKGVQWDLKDEVARNEINNINTKLSEITKNVFEGVSKFDVFMKYLGEDNNCIYYNFWWEPKTIIIPSPVIGFFVSPIDSIKDRIINLSMNILQSGNSQIIQATQHVAGNNNAGVYTYIQNANNEIHWAISGMGILKRIK